MHTVELAVIFFHEMETRHHKTYHIEWCILHPLHFLRFVVTSAAEAELGALFLNCKQATIFHLTLKEMGHPQPPIPINCNNSTAVGITNNTIKCQRSRSMELQFFWVADAVTQGKFDIKYFPRKENLADCQSKHHTGTHHIAVRPWYLHEPTSVRELPRACKPSTLKGCV
jgi:hypothetical protein